MKFRLHHGSLSSSMVTECVIEPTRAALVWALRQYLPYGAEDDATLDVKPYVEGPDHRIGWERTNTVTVRGHVVAFVDDTPKDMNVPQRKPYYTRVLIRNQFGNVVVVVHRDRKVALPGGKIENGEDPKTAAIREVLEETGIIVYELKLIHEGLYEFTDGPHLGIFYEAVNWSGAPANKEPTKLAHVGWVTEAFLMATQHPRLTDTIRAANRG